MNEPVDLVKSSVAFIVDGAKWMVNLFSDKATFEVIAADVGLDPTKFVPPGKLTDARNATELVKLDQFINNNASNFADIAEAISNVDDLITNLIALIDAIKDESIGRTSAQTLHLLFQLFAAQRIQKEHPVLYALGMLGGAAWDAADSLPAYDLTKTFSFKLNSEQGAATYGRALTATALAVPIIYEWLNPPKLGHGNEPTEKTALDLFSSYHGWDLSPTLPPEQNLTPNADSLLRRAFTMRYGDDDALSLTALFVTEAHGGPGIALSLGGEFDSTRTIDGIDYTTKIISGGGANLYIPFGDVPGGARVAGHAAPSGSLRATKAKTDRQALIQVGPKDGTRFEVAETGIDLFVKIGVVGGEVEFKKSKLVLDLGSADGFLRRMSGKPVEVKFGLGIGADSKQGFYLSGGTGLKVALPLTTSIAGAFRIEGMSFAIKPSNVDGMDIATELTGIFGLDIGPFRMSVEEMGLKFDVGFSDPPEEDIDWPSPGFLLDGKGGRFGLAFKPPAGMGLFIDTKAIKGGGYLYFKPEDHEYAGVLELSFDVRCVPVSLKAAGILTTEVEGGDGWALLLIISGEFVLQLPFGFTLRGVGGIVGLQHSVSTDKLQSGLRTGAIDHILFPPDPVKNAPQLLNTLRTLFPVMPRALTVGPTVKLGWSTPPIIIAKLGLLLQWDDVTNVRDLSRIVLLGQLSVRLPPAEDHTKGGKDELIKLLIDVVGCYEFREERLAIDARLRNSHISRMGVKGTLTVRALFGDDPSMILAVGGFHPRFDDLPPGLPKQERITIVLKRGSLTATMESYLAVTSNTFQVGSKVDVKVKAGPVRVHGYLGFDALFEFDPRFSFEIDYAIGASVKFKGKTLAGVDVKGIVAGPGRWTVSGRGKVKVLIFKKRFSFNKSWGSAPANPAISVAVGALLREALSDTANWSAALPRSRDGLVTLGKHVGTGLVVHPWATLEVRQKVVPLNFTIDRFRQAKPSDGNRFAITDVTTGTAPNQEPLPRDNVREHFARGMFKKNIGDRLKVPSFETFDAGVTVGNDQFADVGIEQRVDSDYETAYLKEPTDTGGGKIFTPARPDLSALFGKYAIGGATSAGWKSRLETESPPSFKVAGHVFAVVDPDTLAVVNDVEPGNFSNAQERVQGGQFKVVFQADYEEAV